MERHQKDNRVIKWSVAGIMAASYSIWLAVTGQVSIGDQLYAAAVVAIGVVYASL